MKRRRNFQQLERRQLLAGDVIDLGSTVYIIGDPDVPNEIRIVDAEDGSFDVVTKSGDEQPVSVNVKGVNGFLGQIFIAGGNEADIIDIQTDDYYRSTILGGGGDDIINGGSGVDYIMAGAGNDIVDGGAGRDFLFGELGDDELRGGADNDWLYDTQGQNMMVGGAGIDGYITNQQSEIDTDEDDRFIYIFPPGIT